MLAEMPFETKRNKEGENGDQHGQLTADVGGRAELGGHLWVDVDHDLLLLGHLGVALLDLVDHPGLERLADHGGADVDDPLLGRLRQVRVIRHVGGDVGVLHGELGDILEVEALVLRHVDRLDRPILHVRLLAGGDVLQKVDRGVVWSMEKVSRSGGKHLPNGGSYTSHSCARKV